MTLSEALAKSTTVSLGGLTFKLGAGDTAHLNLTELTSDRWEPVLSLKRQIAEEWTDWLSRDPQHGQWIYVTKAILGALDEFERRNQPKPLSVEEYTARKRKLLEELREVATNPSLVGIPHAVAWQQRIDELVSLEAQTPFRKPQKNPIQG